MVKFRTFLIKSAYKILHILFIIVFYFMEFIVLDELNVFEPIGYGWDKSFFAYLIRSLDKLLPDAICCNDGDVDGNTIFYALGYVLAILIALAPVVRWGLSLMGRICVLCVRRIAAQKFMGASGSTKIRTKLWKFCQSRFLCRDVRADDRQRRLCVWTPVKKSAYQICVGLMCAGMLFPILIWGEDRSVFTHGVSVMHRVAPSGWRVLWGNVLLPEEIVFLFYNALMIIVVAPFLVGGGACGAAIGE